MKLPPVWGPQLYSPENLQRHLRGVGSWRTLLRLKRSHVMYFLIFALFAVCFSIAAAFFSFYIALVVYEPGTNYGLIILGIAFAFVAYTYLRQLLRLVYYLFVDKRDIGTVLATRAHLDHDRQHNIWPR
jgi:hypothetical protein